MAIAANSDTAINEAMAGCRRANLVVFEIQPDRRARIGRLFK